MKKEESVLQIRTAEEFFKLLESHKGALSSIGKYEVYEDIYLSTLAFQYSGKNIPYSIKLGEGNFYGNFSTFNAQMLDLYFENAEFRFTPIIHNGSVIRVFDDNNFFASFDKVWFKTYYRQIPSKRFMKNLQTL